MDILISKTETCCFSSCPNKMKSYGGFDVAALTFLTLAETYPQHKFYFIGSNDIGTLQSKPDNLIDIETPIRIKHNSDRSKDRYDVAVDYCKQYKFDFMICWYCRGTPLVDYNYGYLSNKGTPRKIRECEKIVSRILAVPKAYKIPVYYIMDDIAEFSRLPSDMPSPAAIWSQCDSEINYRHYTNISDVTRLAAPIVYKPIERLWLMGKQKVDWRSINKTNDFIITCNSTNDGSLDRLNYIENWVLNNFKDVTVYGRWDSPKTLVSVINKRGISDRFERKGMCEMEDLMFKSKYTLVIPLSKKYPDFVTQKMFSMLYYGIIPFWCKNDYDCSNTKYNAFPDYIKVESPNELLHKINELNNDEKKYRKLLDDLYGLLEDRYFDNRIVHDIFDEILL